MPSLAIKSSYCSEESYTIVGGGFGLYGYLPALIRGNRLVTLPSKYRAIVRARRELGEFDSRVTWVPTLNDALEKSTGVVIAVTPGAQVKYVEQILRCHNNVEQFILEKPLAPSPSEAGRLLGLFELNSKAIRVGFVFGRTEWAERAISAARGSRYLRINWQFMAHHYTCDTPTWKRDRLLGGGAVRFYGIHLIALLCEIGYRRVLWSRLSIVNAQDVCGWTACFCGDGLATCVVELNSFSPQSSFEIWGDSCCEVKLIDPFEAQNCSSPAEDRRVPCLLRLLCEKNFDDISIFKSINSLWELVESKSQIISG